MQTLRAMLIAIAVAITTQLALPQHALAQEDTDQSFDDDGEPAPKVEAAREILKQTLPAGASREEEIRYLLQRERAAFAVGAGRTRLEALRRLVELHAGTPDAHYFLNPLQAEEWRSGNTQRSLEISEQLVSGDRVPLRYRVEYAAQLSGQYLTIHERRRAWDTLERAERLLGDYMRDPEQGVVDRPVAMVEMMRATLLTTEGRYREAETSIRKAQDAVAKAIEQSRDRKASERFVSLHDSNLRYRTSIYGRYVHLLTASGRHVEAETVARQGLQDAMTDGTLGATIGYWHARIAEARLAQSRYAEAQTLLERALGIYAQAGLSLTSDRVIYARMLKLHALLGQERWAEADAEHRAMFADARDDAVARQRVSSPTLRAVLHAVNGRASEAVEVADGVVRFRARLYGEKNPATLEAKAIRAMALQAGGSTSAALAAYREAFDVIFSDEMAHVDLAARGLRGLYLPLALDAYLKLIAGEVTAGRANAALVSDAFTVTDRLRGSAVQQAMVDSAARAVVANDEGLARLVRSEQDVRNARRDAFLALNRLFAEIRDADRDLKEIRDAERSKEAGAKSGDAARVREKRDAAVKALEGLRRQVASADAEQGKLRQELIRRFPAYYRLVNPSPVRPADVAKRLAPDEALVSVYTNRTHTFVWAISPRGEPLMHVAAAGQETIAADVARLRSTLELGDRTAPAPFNFAAAQRLYDVLLRPVAKALGGARVLTIVASDALGQIPFAVLTREPAAAGAYESAAWLVKDHAIAHVASAAAWVSVRDAAGKAVAGRPFLGFGDPLFAAQSTAAPEKVTRVTVTRALVDRSVERETVSNGYDLLPPLPETRAEILSIAKSLGADPAVSAFFGAAASRARAIGTNLRDYRVVAFATHGLKAGDLPNLSQPALAMAASATPGDSPLLTLDDVLGLQLSAEWVVLSACNTAASDGASDEAISGLARGFFFAGARSMLVTHWSVETASAQALVTAIFEHHAKRAGTTRAGSLREAQLEMISGKASAQYRHPFFWAPYALVGDGSK